MITSSELAMTVWKKASQWNECIFGERSLLSILLDWSCYQRSCSIDAGQRAVEKVRSSCRRPFFARWRFV